MSIYLIEFQLLRVFLQGNEMRCPVQGYIVK